VNGKIHVCLDDSVTESHNLYNFNTLHQMKKCLEVALRLLTLLGESMDADGNLSVRNHSCYRIPGNNSTI